MAYFAKINSDNIVEDVRQVNNEDEHRGNELLNEIGFEGTWIQTSYNTIMGEHRLGGTPFRKNYAGVGYTYDSERDAFIPPKPYASWKLNEDTCVWESPISYPIDGKLYIWDENSTSWVEDN
jgi:hypothetical protein